MTAPTPPEPAKTLRLQPPDAITELQRAAASAAVVANSMETLPDRMNLADPLAMVRMLGEVSVGVGMLAEAIRDGLSALAVEALTEKIKQNGVPGE